MSLLFALDVPGRPISSLLKKKKKVLFVYVQVTLPSSPSPPLTGEYLLTFYQRQNSDVHKRGRSPAR